MKVLVIGAGGREHALCWKLAQSPEVSTVYCAPGNPGVARMSKGECAPIGVNDFARLAAFIQDKDIDLTVVGPEDPLAAGIVDVLSASGRLVFGPSAAAAQLEASKAFAKAFMARHGIPTAAHAEFDDPDEAITYIRGQGAPIVVKADGLAAGKGVTVARDVASAERAVRAAMLEDAFGKAGQRIIVEEFLEGEEASVLAFCDGEHVAPLAPSQDHKPAFDGDKGPNTGGMGAYSPAPLVDAAGEEAILRAVLEPCVRGMAAEGTPYRGILYAGLMMTPQGPKVVEYNCRFGDPETQVVLPRLKGDLAPYLVACCEGGLSKLPVENRPDACVTVVMASGGYPGAYEKGKAISGIDAAEALPGVTVFHAGTRFEGDALRTNGGRVLNVTALGADLPEAIAQAYRAVESIHFDQAHFRRDIGAKALARIGR